MEKIGKNSIRFIDDYGAEITIVVHGAMGVDLERYAEICRKGGGCDIPTPKGYKEIYAGDISLCLPGPMDEQLEEELATRGGEICDIEKLLSYLDGCSSEKWIKEFNRYCNPPLDSIIMIYCSDADGWDAIWAFGREKKN